MAQYNYCWLRLNDHIQGENHFQTRLDNEKRIIDPASLLHIRHCVLFKSDYCLLVWKEIWLSYFWHFLQNTIRSDWTLQNTEEALIDCKRLIKVSSLITNFEVTSLTSSCNLWLISTSCILEIWKPNPIWRPITDHLIDEYLPDGQQQILAIWEAWGGWQGGSEGKNCSDSFLRWETHTHFLTLGQFQLKRDQDTGGGKQCKIIQPLLWSLPTLTPKSKMTRSSHVQVIIVQTRDGILAIHKPASNKNFENSYLPNVT